MRKLIILILISLFTFGLYAQKKVALFEPVGLKDQAIATAVREIISTKFVKSEKFDVVARLHSSEVLKEKIYDDEGWVDTVVEIGKQKKADYVCVMIYQDLATKYLISIKLVNVESFIIEPQDYIFTTSKDDIFDKTEELLNKIFINISAKFGTFIDKRDNQKYKWVKVGTQTWMAENLKFSTSSGYTVYNDNQNNVMKYGYLYNLETAKNACPDGWKLPTKQEFEILFKNIVKENSVLTDALLDTTELGFNLVFGGYFVISFGGIPFNSKDKVGRYWTSSNANNDYFYYLNTDKESNSTQLKYTDSKYFHSVRCIKENENN